MIFSVKKRHRILAYGQNPEEKDKNRALLEEIDAVRRELAQAAAVFDYETEPDLIDACIYQTQALQARYAHLLKCAREEKIESEALPETAFL